MRCLLVALLVSHLTTSAWADEELPTVPHADREGVVTLELPARLAADDTAESERLTGAFKGGMPLGDENAWCVVWVHRLDAYARPMLALDEFFLGADQERLDDRERRGEGFAQVVVRLRDPDCVTVRRAVEDGGRVHVVSVSLWTDDVDAALSVAERILESAKVVKTIPWPSAPAGWHVTEKDGVIVETDRGSKALCARIVREVSQSRNVARQVVEGEPFLVTPARVRAYADNVIYRFALEKLGERQDQAAVFEPFSRLVHVDVSGDVPAKDGANGFWDDLRGAAARQALFEHFGGAPPVFIDFGLRYYVWMGIQSGGNPRRPNAEYVTDARRLVTSPHELAWWLTARPGDRPSDLGVTIHESAAWHRLFRDSKRGKPYRDAYYAYLRVLRDDGASRAGARPLIALDQPVLLAEYSELVKRGK